MFPYPSGAGLHVGHPLGYIASDIYAARISVPVTNVTLTFNVLNPWKVSTALPQSNTPCMANGAGVIGTAILQINNIRAAPLLLKGFGQIGFCWRSTGTVSAQRRCDPVYHWSMSIRQPEDFNQQLLSLHCPLTPKNRRIC